MEKANISKSKGGARPGAGRKRMGATPKSETIGLRVRPEIKERLFRAASDRGISVSEFVARLIEALPSGE